MRYKKLREEVKVVSLQIINERMKILQDFVSFCFHFFIMVLNIFWFNIGLFIQLFLN